MGIDNESADAFRPRTAGAGKNGEVIRDGSAGDVDLVAVEDVIVAVTPGRCLEVGGVRAVVWLRQTEGALGDAVGCIWQVFLLLLLRSAATGNRLQIPDH